MKYWKRIHLVDKFLMVFMAIFMFQSACNLFTSGAQASESNTIDVIVRTSAASIFGYFISANFVRRDSLNPADQEAQELSAKEVVAQEAEDAFEHAETETARNIQVVVTAVIGILSLCILLIFRDFFVMTAAAAGTVSQLRDFVSGCVGFLIGSTTVRKG